MIWTDAFTYEGSVVVPYPGEWGVALSMSADTEGPLAAYRL